VTSVNFGDLYKDAMTLTTGTFDGIVVETTPTESSNGKPMIKVKLQVEGGKHHGKVFFTQFVVSVESSGAMRMFFTNMKAFGLTKDYFESNPPIEQVAAALHGKRCRFTVGVRQWQGVDRESVDKVEPALPGANNLPGLPGVGAAVGPVAGGPDTPPAPGPSAGAQTPSAAGGDVPPPPAF
jgi:hypothetical protein